MLQVVFLYIKIIVCSFRHIRNMIFLI